MRSPIKSVLKNNTAGSFIVPLSNRINLHFNPTGKEYDTITVDGDIFSRLENNAAADRLMRLILDGTLSMNYIIDAMFADVAANITPPLYAGSGELAERIALHSVSTDYKKDEKTPEETPEKDEPEVVITGPAAELFKKDEATVPESPEEKEETAEKLTEVTEETTVEAKEPTVEAAAEEPATEEAPVEEKPIEEPVEVAEPEVVKPKKRASKKIKVD